MSFIFFNLKGLFPWEQLCETKELSEMLINDPNTYIFWLLFVTALFFVLGRRGGDSNVSKLMRVEQ